MPEYIILLLCSLIQNTLFINNFYLSNIRREKYYMMIGQNNINTGTSTLERQHWDVNTGTSLWRTGLWTIYIVAVSTISRFTIYINISDTGEWRAIWLNIHVSFSLGTSCPHCNRICRSTVELLRHLRIHHWPLWMSPSFRATTDGDGPCLMEQSARVSYMMLFT